MLDASDLLWGAVSEALMEVPELDLDPQRTKIEKRIRQCFSKAANGLDWKNSWQQLINEYADSAFGSLFQAMGDRSWITQVDFLLVLDAGVKQTFPLEVLRNVPQRVFEKQVLRAHDRAFEEQRFLPLLWDNVKEIVGGKNTFKKVYDAAENGRKAGCRALLEGRSEIKEFVSRWVECTVARLSKTSQGYPETIMGEEACCELFHSLIQAGALPLSLTASTGGPPPEKWSFVDLVVAAAYSAHAEAGDVNPDFDEALAKMISKSRRERLPELTAGMAALADEPAGAPTKVQAREATREASEGALDVALKTEAAAPPGFGVQDCVADRDYQLAQKRPNVWGLRPSEKRPRSGLGSCN